MFQDPVDHTGLCLLSLDGGGVRGLSSLYLLKAIMARLNYLRALAGLPAVKPCEVFDLIGGTSTGGLIAIMLGRLRMDVDECISEYTDLTAAIFEKKTHATKVNLSGRVQSQFDSKKLKAAIETVITKRGLSPTDLLNDGVEGGCRVFVCAASKELYGITRLRSYTIPGKTGVPATISEAALATSAATGFFSPVSIGARRFVDGALGANNPVDEVEDEASNIWCSETGDLKPLVKCFVSLGTGNPGKKAIEDDVLKFLSKTLVQISTETEDTAKKFIGRWRQLYELKRYFRFNVEQGLQGVGLAEYKERGTIETATEMYLDDQAQAFQVRYCGDNLKLKRNMANTCLEAEIREFNASRQSGPGRDAEKSKLLARLYTSPYKDRKDINPERVKGTCEWFTSHTRFQGWREKEGPALLWVSADPGCGKSVLARYLVDDVLQSADANPRAICYFFFKDDYEDQRTPESALCCIIRQLFIQRPALLSDDILVKFEEEGDYIFNSFSSLWNILTSITSGPDSSGIICIMDALDECTGQSQIVRALSRLYNTRTTLSTLKFLVTSRRYTLIQRGFQALENCQPTIHLGGESQEEVDKISREIDLVIKERIEEVGARLKLRDDEKQTLCEELLTINNRTYLWVHLIFNVIDESIELTKGRLRASIRDLPQSVNEAYDRILRNSHNTGMARKLLHIVVAAERPLSLQEMAVAFAIEDHHHSYGDLEPDLEPEDRFCNMIREVCGLFVVIIDSQIYLLHQTAREFLVRPPSSSPGNVSLEWHHSLCPMESNRIVSEICIWYLFFADFHQPTGDMAPEASGGGSKTHAFLDYSTENWAAHLRKAHSTTGKRTESLALQLCEDPRMRSTWLRAYWKTTTYELPGDFTPLMIASYFGLNGLVVRLLEQKHAGLSSQDSTYKRSALSWASENGHISVVETLLSRVPALEILVRDWTLMPTIINSKDTLGRTPLWYAAVNGHVMIVEMLHKKGAKVNCKDKYGQAPLTWATHKGHEVVVKLLLDRGASSKANGATNLEEKDSDGRTPLSLAAGNGDAAVMHLLLDNGADLEVRDSRDRTPLFWAAKNGHEAAVQLLLDKGADVSARGRHSIGISTGWTPLWWAVGNGHEAVVQLLLEKGANLEDRDEHGMTQLSWAAGVGSVDVMLLLLNFGADLEAKDQSGRTPLSRAAWNGEVSAVLFLILRGADLEAKDNNGMPPPWRATLSMDESVLQLLLKESAEFHAENGSSLTPLQYAVGNRIDGVVQLLDNGAATEPTPEHRITMDEHRPVLPAYIGLFASFDWLLSGYIPEP